MSPSFVETSKSSPHFEFERTSLSLRRRPAASSPAPPPTASLTSASPTTGDHLLVSSWDKTVRLYDASANVLRGEFKHGGPVLDCCFHDDSSGFSAGADNTVRRLVFSSSKEDILGRHDAPVRCVEYSYAAGQLITGSWDKTLKCWDPRGASGQERTLVGTYPQPERVYSLSLVGNRLVVATAGRHVNVYDLRNMSQPEQRRESSLKYQTRCVRCILMEQVMLLVLLKDGYGTFATGGCDGYVNVWDGNNKKRLYQYSKYPTSIAALSFSRDGRLLAVASSYTFEEGDKPHEPDSIFVRSVNEIEVKPKPKVYPNPPA
ncbi:mitotic checkpoint protein BUB3.2 [Prunus yedoensis var. nudiflora]|uniref:Mitotic checkpoint protein BUB3.2 n=1 Tax=Prunus yedoensis var. nudiflora TaxID=2094558 RepID=A0A314YAM3_PRUYE|nr:mitotic checkpoint protein BUB3.2 [Prunus yedoensis var. nudiflora]